LLDLARRNGDRFPHRDDWLGVVAVGEHGRHVGRASTSLALGLDERWSWSTDRWDAFDDVREGFVPIQFEGTIEGPAGASEPPALLVAVNGVVAGVGTQIAGTDPGRWTFSTIVAEELFERGANAVELIVADPTRNGAYLAVSGERDATMTVRTDAAGGLTAVLVGREELDVVPADARQLEVDKAYTDGRTVVVDGWATDTDLDRAPKDVALIVDGRRVSTGVDPYPALAEPTGQLADWGFRLSVPDSAVGGATSGTVLALFDGVAVATPVDWSD
jgi:hypothetical protein